ncbi:BadF/BadG/BcrA/BcrD ATPase family protein [Asanoa sp. WMMD1127]|uniref:N-acetylglucosamine kinase n=1 Tax=Asanoa sp. WMMD1127 TaxID=3016107 RepID=UPI002415F72B|nr:BadF/BadG/BcrA/BcrD ATPase family protein [Asanoa sp. WMMD1127]MDG4820680.1 BadF/BadG/BcrA/BcrD ATPase family protein [Asanoa sp. WMMD1127]
MSEPLVIGGDCGGTSTRVVVTTLDGAVVGRGRGGPGNPVARPPAETAATLVGAVREALGDLDPARVAGAVVGVAGYSRLATPDGAAAYASAWAGSGVPVALRTVGDAVVAYAAGGHDEPNGSVLIAGTGAIACEIVDWSVGRRVDGIGWLLGDEGSGFWFGVAAARHTAHALHAGASGALTSAVHAAVGGVGPEGFVSAFYALARDKMAGLAPLVFEAARAGDPAAEAIVADGADRLLATLSALRPGPGPIVLAGGLLTAVPELREAVRTRLRATLGRDALLAGDAAEAAARLAVLDLRA